MDEKQSEFVDDNTTAVTYSKMKDFCTLKKISESAVDWFKHNNMIVNPNFRSLS